MCARAAQLRLAASSNGLDAVSLSGPLWDTALARPEGGFTDTALGAEPPDWQGGVLPRPPGHPGVLIEG